MTKEFKQWLEAGKFIKIYTSVLPSTPFLCFSGVVTDFPFSKIDYEEITGDEATFEHDGRSYDAELYFEELYTKQDLENSLGFFDYEFGTTINYFNTFDQFEELILDKELFERLADYENEYHIFEKFQSCDDDNLLSFIETGDVDVGPSLYVSYGKEENFEKLKKKFNLFLKTLDILYEDDD